MQILKTLFWVVVAVALALFSIYNWTPVTLTLWNGMLVVTKLPLLLLVAFLVGLLPTLVLHWTTRWRLRKRLDTAERSLADSQAAAAGLDAPLAEPPALP